MKSLNDPNGALNRGLAAIRTRFKVAASFPPEVLAAADVAARRAPTEHVDRTDWAFVTLDPASSTDLDQAFVIERRGADLVLRYAIADVCWFVEDGGVIDAEAWRRGMTQYLPDGRASLYPPVLCEAAASLLPSGPRPSVIFSVKVAPDGGVMLEGVERAIIRSRAKLAYDTATDAELPEGFAELADRITAAEQRRGAVRVDPPEQAVEKQADGRLELQFRPRLLSEDRNAALSLATNMAVGDAMLAHHTGLFRVMPDPSEWAVKRLRLTAKAFGLDWPSMARLSQFERTLDPTKPIDAAFMLAIRRASEHAAYAPYQEGETPWHSAMAATYAHTTAPLRRLADRYVVRTALAIANGQAVPAVVTEAFGRLPDVMSKADQLGGQLDRAVIDLAETVMLSGDVGQNFDAVVTDVDDRGVRIQLCDKPVVSRLVAHKVEPGQRVRVRLDAADPEHPPATFTRVS